jgi:hypothetical protein
MVISDADMPKRIRWTSLKGDLSRYWAGPPAALLPLTDLKGNNKRYQFRTLLVGLYISSTLYCGLVITSNEVIAAWENARP